MISYSYSQIVANPELVSTVNRVYHDVESEMYDSNHPEILDLEVSGWDRIFEKFFKAQTNNKVICIDIGTGTGFVVSVLSKYLKAEDSVIFTDISQKMLNVCKKRFINSRFKQQFVKTDAMRVSLPNSIADLITVNSVLHHISDTTLFFKECDRLLQSGGLIIIKHEPNRRFAQSLVLSNLYSLIRMVKSLKRSIRSFFVLEKKFTDMLSDQTIKRLGLEENIECNLSREQLRSIVDIHSPTAGGKLDVTRGFDPYEIVSFFPSNYDVVELNTYGYLGKVNDRGSIVRLVFMRMLKALYPSRGYFFDLTLKKND